MENSLEKMINLNNVLVEVSNHHVHLSKEHLEVLFGENYKLTKKKMLSQPGQYSAEENITLKHNKYEIKDVRIIGPLRQQTQVEISATDSRNLKIMAPYRLSGDINNTPGITLVGPLGNVILKEGVIIARRHLHIPYTIANYFGIKNGQEVSVYIDGERAITYHGIIVRTGSSNKTTLAVHLDSDEGNSSLIKGNTYGKVII